MQQKRYRNENVTRNIIVIFHSQGTSQIVARSRCRQKRYERNSKGAS